MRGARAVLCKSSVGRLFRSSLWKHLFFHKTYSHARTASHQEIMAAKHLKTTLGAFDKFTWTWFKLHSNVYFAYGKRYQKKCFKHAQFLGLGLLKMKLEMEVMELPGVLLL